MPSPARPRSTVAVSSAIAIAVVATLTVWLTTESETAAYGFSYGPDALESTDRVERGRYLATAANCASCHDTDQTAFMAGGVSFQTDFGTIVSTNITPDRETGIGLWSPEEFLRSMRHGQRPNGEHLYPVFPYTSFTRMTDEDIFDLFAYLRSIPPVRRKNTGNDLDFPYNVRALMKIWKALYLDAGALEADTQASSEWNRGAYLTKALAHCDECHSPRNLLGAKKSAELMTGGEYLDSVPGDDVRPWSAPDLTSTEMGLGMWPHEEIVAYLANGKNAYVESFGPMNEVIVNSTQHLHTGDVRAMATYLKSLPGLSAASRPEPDERTLGMGRTQYNLHCGTCHLPTGLGDEEMAPRLAQGSLVVRAENPASLINVILYAPEQAELDSPSAFRKPMDEFQYLLNDDEVAALASFVRHSWKNEAGEVTPDQVARQRQ